MINYNSLLRWWVTPKLPAEHIIISLDKRPKGLYQITRIYFRKWIIHPVKRRIAKYYLKFLQRNFGITVIGITGSCGKTTTKEMIASILRQKGETVTSVANIDPVYNIPSSILRCKLSTKYLVLEMGVEYPGEMDFYLWLAKPTIGVITNIYPTHTLFFKSTRGVAIEKLKLIKSLKRSDFAILNTENKYLKQFARKVNAKVVGFGHKGNVWAKNVRITKDLNTKFTLVLPKNKSNIQLSVIGLQFVENALAAASIGYILGISGALIKRGLESYIKPEHRMIIIKHKSGAFIIDDSYNNNPEAAKKALDTFKLVAGKKKKVVVFGDMLELGRQEVKYHKQVGEYIGKIGIEYLIAVGSLSRILTEEAKKRLGSGKIFWVKSKEEVKDVLLPLLDKDSWVLIKGSRSVGLDEVVKSLV